MSESRPFVLTVAGFDPSAGAGVLADIKTFEQHRVYGLAVCTANTLQTETRFEAIQWTNTDFVLTSIKTLLSAYDVKAVKIGIVPSLEMLELIIQKLKRISPAVKILWDPVLKSSTEFDFLSVNSLGNLHDILDQLDLLTPNYSEAVLISGNPDADAGAVELSSHCPVLLKGGHHPLKKGADTLYLNGCGTAISSTVEKIYEKHGSGCTLSSAITANLALGQDLKTACCNAKAYIETYLNTTSTLLGHHYV